MHKTKTVVIIPSYNEGKVVIDVIKHCLNFCDVILVDDFSTDNTKNLVSELRVNLVVNKKNLGYEKSLAVGLQKAISKGYKYAITLDADGQLSPNYINKFIYLLDKDYDLVIGNRDIKQRFSEFVISYIGKVVWKINDPLCGLKGYKINSIKKLKLYSYCSIGTEILSRSIRNGLKIAEYDIKLIQRSDKSRIGNNGFKTNLKFILCFLNNFIKN